MKGRAGATPRGLRVAGAVASAFALALSLAPAANAAAPSTPALYGGTSADGSKVFFESGDPLVEIDTDVQYDVYQRSGGTTTLVSRAAPGASQVEVLSASEFLAASTDGNRVIFASTKALVAADTDSCNTLGCIDIYERFGGVTSLISQGQPGFLGTAATDNAVFLGASADATHVFFVSSLPLAPEDTDAQNDIYERFGGVTTLVSRGEAALGNGAFDVVAPPFGNSADGSRAFFGTGEKLVAGDTDANCQGGCGDVYERSGGTTALVSQGVAPRGNGETHASFVANSADGSRVFFVTTESLLAADDDDCTSIGVFPSCLDVYERAGGVTTLVSTGPNAPGAFGSFFDAASADGDRVFFSTGEALAAGDTDGGSSDIYQRSGGATTLTSAGEGALGNGSHFVQFKGISASGSHAFFETAEQLVAGDTDGGLTDVYQRSSGTTTQVTAGTEFDSSAFANVIVSFAGVSPDGARVFFEAQVTNMSGQLIGRDIYERSSGTTTRVNQPNSCCFSDSGRSSHFKGVSSGSGEHVFFETTGKLTDDDVAPGDSGDCDPFVAGEITCSDVYERSGGTTILVSVDARPPNTTITGGPTGETADRTPTFEFSADESFSTFECRFDAAAFAACSGPGGTHTPATQLDDGAHVFEARAIDRLGNVETLTPTRSFTVDTTPPDVRITSGPEGPTSNTTPSFGFAVDGAFAEVQCRFDSAGFGPCSGPGSSHAPAAPLGEGGHTFRVRAIDAVGNVGPQSTRSFTVDTVPPDTSISGNPATLTNDPTPSFAFTSTEPGSTFRCNFAGEPVAACSGPGGTHTREEPLTDGAHVFSVSAVDAAGNADDSPAPFNFTVDTVPPSLSITGGPSGPTNNATPTFSFNAGDATTRDCRFDSAAFGTCSGAGSHAPGSALSEGAHTFEMRATDAAGNAATSTRSFTVDTQGPTVTITGPSKVKTKKRKASARFSFAANEQARFECSVDRRAFASCSSPFTTRKLRLGTHSLVVRATDLAGNSATRSKSFRILRKR